MSTTRFAASVLLAVGVFHAGRPLLLAQAGQSEIAGEVRDSTGARVPGANVVAVDVATQRKVATTTGAGGLFVLSSLRPGRYLLEVEAAGFRSHRRDGLELRTGERARVDVVLEVGAFTESATVTADVPLLKTERSDVGQVVANREVVQLPLNGRSYILLVALVPGVALPPGSILPRINGGRPRVNEYIYDGISVLQPEPGTVPYLPVIDGIQEFKVVTNSPPAEFGRFNGGVINLSTKSGSNALRGSAWEFLRHEALNARNLFAPGTAENPDKPRFRRNQFGFVLGGPIVKDRTFFFADYQGSRQSIERVRISTVPTALQRQGIFTERVAGQVPALYDPATTQPVPGGGFTRQPFAGGVVPPERFDPVAAELLSRYPLPNLPGTANNYRRLGNEDQDADQIGIRIDHRASASDQFFGRLVWARDYTEPVIPLPDGSGNLTAGALGPTNAKALSATLNYVRVLRPDTVNELRLGYTERRVDRVGLALPGSPSQILGLPGIPTNAAFSDALPTFVLDGFQQLGSPPNTFSDSKTAVFQLVDVFSWQRGRHAFKFGLDWRYEALDVVQPPSPTGSFRFTSQGTDLPGRTGTGLSLASFVLGQVQNFAIDLQQNELRPRALVQEYFAQDDWRVTSRLTINAGVRFTLNFPSTEKDDQGAVFNRETELLEYAGRDGNSRSARKLHWLNAGPRIGFAWQVTPRTVLRSGYALVWIEQAGITTPFTLPQFPFLQNTGQRSLDNVRPAFPLASGPTVTPVGLTPDAGLGQGVFGADRELGSGYLQQWNLTVQRELSANLAVEVGYAGSKGTHIGVPDTNINQLTIDQLALGNTLLQRVPNPYFGQVPVSSSIGGATTTRGQLLRPYPRFTNVSLYRNNVGNTIYHAFLAKVEKRFSRGLSFLVSYTYSKLIDDAGSVFDASIVSGPVANFPVADSYNRALERDVSTGDMTHVFVSSLVWDLPAGAGRRFEPKGVLGVLLNDWQLSGVVTFQSGMPFPVTQVTNFNAFAGFGTQRPNVVADPTLPASERGTTRWFDTAAFQVAPQFTLGNASRNPVRGPGYRNLDMALIKRIALGRRPVLELRLEGFNLTNTPPLAQPNGILGSPGFGSITAAGDPRVLQVGVKLHF
jgi:Carboxypeptidase regulatory-like domain